MDTISNELKKYLFYLARKTIAEQFNISEKEFDQKSGKVERPSEKILEEKRGVFVTLEILGSLRGCIGNIIPVYPLEEAVKRNAINAAFDDPRFMPLDPEEFEEIEIEISILTVPEKLDYKDAQTLLQKLVPLRDGVIFKKGFYQATYLPQVWEELAQKEEFCSSLCLKAGLDADAWKKEDLEVSVYQAVVLKED